MSSLDFDEKVKQIVLRLNACALPYALGGAIAYGYYGVPRATRDIDINVFIQDTEGEKALDCLAALGVRTIGDGAIESMRSAGQIRLDWDGTFVDLFFAYQPFHDVCRTRARDVLFGELAMKVLSGEDIVLFKLLFNRPHDWTDIERVVAVQGPALDREYIRQWLVSFVGQDDGRVERFDELSRRYNPN
jgi:hypothetical protein